MCWFCLERQHSQGCYCTTMKLQNYHRTICPIHLPILPNRSDLRIPRKYSWWWVVGHLGLQSMQSYAVMTWFLLKRLFFGCIWSESSMCCRPVWTWTISRTWTLDNNCKSINTVYLSLINIMHSDIIGVLVQSHLSFLWGSLHPRIGSVQYLDSITISYEVTLFSISYLAFCITSLFPEWKSACCLFHYLFFI